MSRRSVAPLLGLLAALAIGGAAVATELPAQLGDWTVDTPKTYVGGALYEHINGGAELFHEYGFVVARVGYYRNGEKEILVEIYEMASPAAAHALYRFTRNPEATRLGAPYTGSTYDLYLEAVQGQEYLKLAGHGAVTAEDRQALLALLVPEPLEAAPLEGIGTLPAACTGGSEVVFHGPLALRNFAHLGDGLQVPVGEGALAAGCRVQVAGEARRWVVLTATAEQVEASVSRYLEFQRRSGLEVTEAEGAHVVTDPLTGKVTVVVPAETRVSFVPALPAEVAGTALARIRALATEGPAG